MSAADLSEQLAPHLPFLRRCARAMTGTQSSGDAFAVATLEAIVAEPSILNGASTTKVALFRAFHDIWTSGGATVDTEATGVEAKAQEHLASLTLGSREALLLSSIEQFSNGEIAEIMRTSVDTVSDLLGTAHAEMAGAMSGKILVIEDEVIIAMDIGGIVSEMGHTVVGNARTHADAVLMAGEESPDLVLADIQLADNSSGIDAIRDILELSPSLPVIFITAFPERFLTGQRPEPAFLITKPYSEEQVRSAVSQAMFFASTDTRI